MTNSATAKEPLERLILKDGIIVREKDSSPVKAVAVGAPILRSHDVDDSTHPTFNDRGRDTIESLCAHKPMFANAFLAGETQITGSDYFGSRTEYRGITAVQYYRI